MPVVKIKVEALVVYLVLGLTVLTVMVDIVIQVVSVTLKRDMGI